MTYYRVVKSDEPIGLIDININRVSVVEGDEMRDLLSSISGGPEIRFYEPFDDLYRAVYQVESILNVLGNYRLQDDTNSTARSLMGHTGKFRR
jgi:hypothetical protein